MMDEVDDAELVVERIAALDLGKAGLEACVRVPSPHRPGRRMQELRGYGTTTAQLLEMVAWLRRSAHRATLEAEGFECWLVNAREVKNVPGRAKTDRADAIWLAKVAERGMCRPSLVHPAEIRRLRDLTRYRRALVQDRTREQQRIEKLLEDAQIKIFIGAVGTARHVTARAMMDALIAGQRDPRALAQLAKGRARKKTAQLEEALRGFFTDHHAAILRMMLDNTDRISAQIAALDARIEKEIGPFSGQAARLAEIPGVDAVAAAELIAEIGVDMTRFPSDAHLVSWAKFCALPGRHRRAHAGCDSCDAGFCAATASVGFLPLSGAAAQPPVIGVIRGPAAGRALSRLERRPPQFWRALPGQMPRRAFAVRGVHGDVHPGKPHQLIGVVKPAGITNLGPHDRRTQPAHPVLAGL